jgi:hypothetical protein
MTASSCWASLNDYKQSNREIIMELTSFTFKDTGITVKIRKISPMLAADVAAAIPEPLPPEQTVDYGEPRGKVSERNYSDPNYLVQMAQHNIKVFRALQRVMILRSVTVDGDEWKAEVQEYRDFIEKHTDKPLDEPEDLVVYVLRICVGSEEDLNDFLSYVTRRSQPTPEAVEAAKDSFRRTL